MTAHVQARNLQTQPKMGRLVSVSTAQERAILASNASRKFESETEPSQNNHPDKLSTGGHKTGLTNPTKEEFNQMERKSGKRGRLTDQRTYDNPA
jgi:hypothetical protein